MSGNLLEERDRFTECNPVQKISIRGRKWGVISAGDEGPKLLMLPGTLGRANIFWQQFEALSGRARLLALSYPANHDLDVWVDDLVRLLDRYEINRTTVMGSSLGGYLAQLFASKYPDRVNVLIAANTLSSTEGIAQKPPYAGDLAGVPMKLLRQGFLHGLKQREAQRPSEKELYQILIPEVEGGIPARHLRARLLALKHAPPIGTIQIPADRIAVVESDDDPLIIPPVRDGVRAFLDPATTYRFSEGGHFPYVTKPDAYLSLLEEQLGLEITGTDWGKGKERSS